MATSQVLTIDQARQIHGYNIIQEIHTSKSYYTYIGENNGEYVIIKVSKSYEADDALLTEANWLEQTFYAAQPFTDLLRHTDNTLDYGTHYTHPLQLISHDDPTANRAIVVYAIPVPYFETYTTMSALHQNTVIDTCTSARILHGLLAIYSMEDLRFDNDDSTYPYFSVEDYLISPKQRQIVCYNHSELTDFTDEQILFSARPSAIIKEMAQLMIGWIPPNSGGAYRRLLEMFKAAKYDSFTTARTALHHTMMQLWKFDICKHPFTYRWRDKNEWGQS